MSPHHHSRAAQAPVSQASDRSFGRTLKKTGMTLCILAAAAGAGHVAWRANKLWRARENEWRQAKTDVQQLSARELQRERQLTATQASLSEAQRTARELSALLAATDSRLSEFEEERSVVEARLAEFQEVARQFRSMVDSGQLQVVFRKGRMVVELPSQLLFPSGSADLTPEGADAVKQVAEILKKVSGRRFAVVGHTDDVPVYTDKFHSNWDLSVARALHVTQGLIAAGVKPQQLMTAGRAEFEPVASNRTEAGRSKNRRIEIALEPNLMKVDDLLEMDDKKPKTARASQASHAESAVTR